MKRSLLALTLLAALPFAASAADNVSYNYIEGGYLGTSTDTIGGRSGERQGSQKGQGKQGTLHKDFSLFNCSGIRNPLGGSASGSGGVGVSGPNRNLT